MSGLSTPSSCTATAMPIPLLWNRPNLRFIEGAGDGGDGGGDQRQFTAITSQEELDRAIGPRLARERDKFQGFESYKERAEKYDQLEAAQKTELQRATDSVTAADAKTSAAEARAAAAETQLLRYQVAAAKGITGDDLVLLTGSDKDGLEKQADRIIALNKGQKHDPGQGREGHAGAGSAGAAEAKRRFGDGTK